LSENGVTPDKSKIRALTDFPSPTNLTELRSFLGLANQLGGFINKLTAATDPLRSLLKKDVDFRWTPDLEEAFTRAKSILSSPAVVSFYDPALPLTLLSDASNLNGLGFALVQYHEDHPRLIQCGSRSLTDTEKRYAPVELEGLGINWAIDKCRHYLLGLSSFNVITDHNPLVGIFKKDIGDIDNRRLQRYRENLQQYSFTVEWVPGKVNLIADAFSRNPVEPADVSDDSNVYLVSSLPRSIAPLIVKHAAENIPYQQLLQTITSRKNPNSLPPDRPHQSHGGFLPTKRLAQDYYYWPGMVDDIRSFISRCQTCIQHQPHLKPEPLQSSHATYPMELVAIDLFTYAGKHSRLSSWFLDFGFPTKIRSDGGPQFRSDFNSFCSDLGIIKETSSPYYPESNGLAESAVKNMKRLLKRTGGSLPSFQTALLAWRNLPKSHGFSPAQLFFGRSQKESQRHRFTSSTSSLTFYAPTPHTLSSAH